MFPRERSRNYVEGDMVPSRLRARVDLWTNLVLTVVGNAFVKIHAGLFCFLSCLSHSLCFKRPRANRTSGSHGHT